MTNIIQPFQTDDREALLQIGAETAFFGEPIERYMEDRRIFMDAFYTYYTDYEPEHAWVARVDGQVVGFLTGCVDTYAHDRAMRNKILPRLLRNALRGGYRCGPMTWRYLKAGLGAFLRGEIAGADLARFPAHLHINLLPEFRGQGLGRRLIEAYLSQLKELRVPGVHLQTTSSNTAACHLYETTGFHLLAARATGMYTYLLGKTIEMRCYGLEISNK